MAARYVDAYVSVVLSASQFVLVNGSDVRELDVRTYEIADVDLQVMHGGTIIIDTEEATGVGRAFGPRVDVSAFLLTSIPSQQTDYIIVLPETSAETTLPRFVP